MKLSKKTALTVITGLLLLPGIVAANAPITHSKVDHMTQIGNQPFQMVESDRGVFFMSANGRYVIKGELIDMWENERPLKTVDALIDSIERVNLKSLGLKIDDLMNLTYGSGPDVVTIFVAPGCSYCKQTLAQMNGLEDKYTFHIVPLPIMGPRSEDAVRRISCAIEDNNKPLALRSLVIDKYDDLQARANCDIEKVGRSLLFAQVLGVRSVPYMIDHKNRISTGAPQNLAAHLNR